ncbi:unnamed protein product [Clonostachys rosea f. rosea IK726]|uniref:Uncharacterized protein n=1 Tax=Clonostachys rosea f. rosea IK726 TaxID=1349383 RepID=A0ACA9TYF7_BIOOC|nr:unnamed protein product [Clonostachys rosea f. rosea IK726]
MASESQQKCARVLSIVAFEDIREPDWSSINSIVSTSAKCATKRLTLVLVNHVFVARSEARASLFPYVQLYVTTITSPAQTSVESAAVAVDVLLFGWSDLQLSAYTWDQVYSNSPSRVKEIIGDAPYSQVEPISRVTPSTNTDQVCANEVTMNVVSVNGTFDHLHIGHKTLVLLAAWLATKTLICAVSAVSPSDPSHKKLHQLSESFERRQCAVRQFIEGFQTFKRRPFELKVVPRKDYGPQVSERELDAIVLSTESMHHGDIVNRLRAEANLPPVKVFVVDAVQAAGSIFSYSRAQKLTTRMSSSLVRESLNKRSLKFILLNGFAGVGKFTIASQLASCLVSAGLEARVVHNHLQADLADAVCPNKAPTYQTFRRQLRNLVFEAIRTDQHIPPGTTFVFTGNFSQSMVGQTAAQDIEELERRIVSKSRFEVSSRKLLDPARGGEIAAQKVLYTFEHPQALSLEVSSMSAEQAAELIAQHIKNVHQKSDI